MSADQTSLPAPSPGRRRLRLLPAAIVAALAVAGLVYWLMVRNWVSTDDAQVEGDLVPISSRVDGYVDRIEVDDNQEVSAGQVLVHLDRRDLQARLRSAQAAHGLQSAQAGAATTQVSLTARTATSGQEQAGASTSAAHSGVAAARTQVAAAEAQAEAVQAAADAALDAVAAAESEVETATAQIAAAQAAVEASDADVTSADAQAKKAASDAARFRGLYAEAVIAKEQLQATEATDVSAQSALKAARQRSNAARASLRQAEAGKVAAQAGTRQAKSRAASTQASADQARAAVRTAEAALSEAQARLSAARAAESGARTARQQIAISQSQRKAAAARLRQAAADVENASLLLSYTLITAPVSGVVSEKSVELGQYVQPGQLLMALVPLADVWVAANLKETQIGGMRAGQRAIIEVDAYRGISLAGRVNSIGAATGAKFSLLPPENATGNFVKVVQRIPVKIVLDRPLPKGVILRPGMNVIARVKVRGGG